MKPGSKNRMYRTRIFRAAEPYRWDNRDRDRTGKDMGFDPDPDSDPDSDETEFQ